MNAIIASKKAKFHFTSKLCIADREFGNLVMKLNDKKISAEQFYIDFKCAIIVDDFKKAILESKVFSSIRWLDNNGKMKLFSNQGTLPKELIGSKVETVPETLKENVVVRSSNQANEQRCKSRVDRMLEFHALKKQATASPAMNASSEKASTSVGLTNSTIAEKKVKPTLAVEPVISQLSNRKDEYQQSTSGTSLKSSSAPFSQRAMFSKMKEKLKARQQEPDLCKSSDRIPERISERKEACVDSPSVVLKYEPG